MDEKLIYLQLGALLHYIGKIVRRAGLDSKEHSKAGSNYLKNNNLLADRYKEIYDMIDYHHAKYLSSADLKEDLAASFLGTVVDILCEKTLDAAVEKNVKTIMLAGGVAANSLLRSQLAEKAAEKGIKVIYPSMKLCTDNAAMIAEAAYYKLKNSKNKEDCFAGLDLNGVASLMVSDEKVI